MMKDLNVELLYRFMGDYMMTDAERLQSSLRKEVDDVRYEFKRHLDSHCCHKEGL